MMRTQFQKTINHNDNACNQIMRSKFKVQFKCFTISPVGYSPAPLARAYQLTFKEEKTHQQQVPSRGWLQLMLLRGLSSVVVVVATVNKQARDWPVFLESWRH